MATDYMQGWDTIVAVKQPQINRGLAQAYDEGRIPKEFDAAFKIPFLGAEIDVELEGSFGLMQIYSGSGTLVKLLLPVATGMITGPNGFQADVSGLKAYVSLNLSYVQSQVQPAEGTSYDIIIDFTNLDAWAGMTLADVPAQLQDQADALALALTGYLQQQTVGKSYAIASVDIGSIDAQPEFSYVVPKLVRYAMLTSDTSSDENVFAILMQTVSAAPGTEQVLAGTIPDGNEAALLISNSILMRQIIAPAIAKGFNIETSKLIATGDPTVITNDGEIAAIVDADGPKDITIQQLTAKVDRDSLSIELKIMYVVSPGIYLIYAIAPSRYAFEVVSKDGVDQLELKEVEFISSKSVEMAWWVWLLAGTVGLVFVSIVIAAVVAAIGLSLVAILAAMIKSKAPDLKSSVIVGAAKPVKWSYSEVFVPEKVLLPSALQVGGRVPLLPAAGLDAKAVLQGVAAEAADTHDPALRQVDFNRELPILQSLSAAATQFTHQLGYLAWLRRWSKSV